MRKLTRKVKSITLRTKWIFMSPKERYAFLWARTQKLGNLDFSALATTIK